MSRRRCCCRDYCEDCTGGKCNTSTSVWEIDLTGLQLTDNVDTKGCPCSSFAKKVTVAGDPPCSYWSTPPTLPCVQSDGSVGLTGYAECNLSLVNGEFVLSVSVAYPTPVYRCGGRAIYTAPIPGDGNCGRAITLMLASGNPVLSNGARDISGQRVCVCDLYFPASVTITPKGPIGLTSEFAFQLKDQYILSVSGVDRGSWHWQGLNPCVGQPCNAFGATLTFDSGLDGSYVLDRLPSGGWSSGGGNAQWIGVTGTIQSWTAWMPYGTGIVGPVATLPCDTPLGTQPCDMPGVAGDCITAFVDSGPGMFAYYIGNVGIALNCTNRTYQWGGSFCFEDLASKTSGTAFLSGAGQSVCYRFASDTFPFPANGSPISPPGKMKVTNASAAVSARAGEPGWRYQTCLLPPAEFSLS